MSDDKRAIIDEVASSDRLFELADRFIKTSEKEARWRTIRWMVIIFVALAYLAGSIGWQLYIFSSTKPSEYVSMVRVQGSIGPAPQANIMTLNSAFEKAFSDTSSAGVVALINSPGGTPAQSLLIYQRLMELKEQYGKRLVVVGEDMVTSGAYLVSLAGDAIYAPPTATVGSIGVKIEGFDFSGFIEKYGVERRILTAGENKVRLDPFKKIEQEDREKFESYLTDIHLQFKALVEERRAGKLVDDPSLLSGDFWTGREAVEKGLIDGNDTLYSVLGREFGVTRFFEYTPDYSMGDIFQLLRAR